MTLPRSDPSCRSEALLSAFDRVSGAPISAGRLLTYQQALSDYHLNTESKFRNGGRFDSGRTERRHVEVLSVVYIGKEADRLEEAVFLGLESDIEYPASPEGRAALVGEVLAAIKKFGRKKFEEASGLAPSHLSTIVNGAGTITPKTRVRLGSAVTVLSEEAEETSRLLDRARNEIARIGLRPFGREIGEDPSNIARALKSQRAGRVPSSLVGKLRVRFT